MKTFIFQSNPQFSPSFFLTKRHLFSFQTTFFPRFSRQTSIFFTPTLNFPSSFTPSASSSSSSFPIAADSNSTSYGGWGDFDQSGESTQLRSFLVSLGLDDRKYVFVFLLGVICALAVARVKVSTIAVFPAAVIVFAVGFSFGFFKRGDVSEVSVVGVGNDESVRVCLNEVRSLFPSFEDNLFSLKRNVNGAIYDGLNVGDLEKYVEIIDSLSSSVSHGRIVVEGCLERVGGLENLGNSNGEVVENQKSSRRKKVGEPGYDFSQIFSGFFPQNSASLKQYKSKENSRNDKVDLTPAVEDFSEPVNTDNSGNRKVDYPHSKSAKPLMFNQAKIDKLEAETTIRKSATENGEIGFDSSTARFIDDEEHNYDNRRFQTRNNHIFSQNLGHRNTTETWTSYDSTLDSVNFSVSVQRKEIESSFHQEQILRETHESYPPSQTRESNEIPRSNNGENGYFSSSSIISDDVLFDKYLSEANRYLKQAREFLRSGTDDDRTELILYKSSEILSKAIAMKPMSLLAVGQLGNTYLLHGELKLKTSRVLRTRLRGNRERSDFDSRKHEIVSRLVNVCEECEELLVEAGKSYRMALSINGNDTRALYNWGLALSFRAQLIADIGPKAAVDADKVFLAAIDKFDAMMAKSNTHTPEALYRWGVALQQRSRLRPPKSKEKVKLLKQAKQLYQDALDINSKNVQVREALSSCISELNLMRF